MKGIAVLRAVRRVGVACLLLWVAAAGAQEFPEPSPLTPPLKQELPDAVALLAHLKLDPGLEFCGVKVPSQNEEVRERFEKELLLALWNRPQVILWLKRSKRYFPHIEELLRANNLPDDLKYIAVAESALLPYASSRKGAIGFWQFMEPTARKYGLKIDAFVDERRNLFASTAAALSYLRELYLEFGSWELAAAAYNMGEKRLSAEILEQGTNNFYELYLSQETQRFIFQIIAAKLLISSPEKYGFNLRGADYYSPLAFDRVEVDCPRDIPIRIIAQAGHTSFKGIKDLNPDLRGHYLGKGTHKVLIPKGAAEEFRNNYPSLASKFLAAQDAGVYVVQKGDNLTAIAERFNVPLAALLIWNRLDLNRPIHPGQRLTIYREEAETAAPQTGRDEDETG